MLAATSASAHAQHANPQTSALAYDMPSQSLTAALTAIAQRSGLKLAYSAPLSAGRTAPALHGTYTPAQAIGLLLAGSGLNYRFSNAHTVTIDTLPPASAFSAQATTVELSTINVEGASNPNSTLTPPPAYAGGQVANGAQLGMLGNRSVMNTPFNQTSYTSQTILDQQAISVRDVLLNDPSIRLTTPSLGNPSDTTRIRGFVVGTGDIAMNGLYGIAPFFTVNADFLERVEVLKGPSALLNGMPPGGGVGGTINLVTKHATDTPITQFTTSYNSNTQFGEHVDIGRRFGQDNAFGVRFNASYANGYSPVQYNRNERGLATLGLDYHGDSVRFSADGGYQRTYTKGLQFGMNFMPGLPVLPPPDAAKNYFVPWTYIDTQDIFGMIRGEFDITKTTTVYAAAGIRENANKWYYGYPLVQTAAGDYSVSLIAYPLTTETVSAQTGIRSTFDTGMIHHATDLNATYLNSFTQYNQLSTTLISNLYNPRPLADPGLRQLGVRKSSVSTLGSVGLADTLSVFDERVQLTLGVRRQQITTDSFNLATSALTSTYATGAWSPAFALVVKPWENVSLYANYIQGLQQGVVVAANYANAGQVLPPVVTRQIETGVKVDWGRIMTTFSLFEISQPNSVISPLTQIYSNDGELRNRGLEFNVFGELTEGVRLLGGFMVIDSRQVKTSAGLYDGKKAQGVSDLQLNLGAEWDLPFVKGLTLNGRIISTSGQYADQANTQAIPNWTRLNVGARYSFVGPWGKEAVFRFNIENLTNKTYWESAFPRTALGNPRIFSSSLTLNF